MRIASLAEGVAIAERAGFDLAVVAEAIATGQAASPQVERNSRRMVDNDHEHNVVFPPVLRLKDVEYAVKFSRTLGIGSPSANSRANSASSVRLAIRTRMKSKIIEVARLQTPAASKYPSDAVKGGVLG